MTGAARGIGGAETKLFSKLGVNVVAVDLNFDESREDGVGKVVRLQADVSDSNSAERAVSKCMNEFGRLDILVNNAAVNKGGTVLDYKPEEWDQTLNVNIGGCRNFVRAAATEMKKNDPAGLSTRPRWTA